MKGQEAESDTQVASLEIENQHYKMKQGNAALKKNIESSSGYKWEVKFTIPSYH